MMVDAGWHPVALASDLEPGTSAGTRLFGREIVVWRDKAGMSHVWEDRCPHRGMRLSFGFVRGDHLACLYHGWQFDGAGQCRFIPAHPRLDVPETIKVTGFASAEQLGMIWVSFDAGAASGPPPGGNAATTPVRSLAVAAPIGTVLAALDVADSPWDAGQPVILERSDALIWLKAGGDSLAVALQPLTDEDVCLHIAIGGMADGDRIADRSRVSLWAESLRRRAEADAARLARVR